MRSAGQWYEGFVKDKTARFLKNIFWSKDIFVLILAIGRVVFVFPGVLPAW